MPQGRAINRKSEIIAFKKKLGHGIMSEVNFKPSTTQPTNNNENNTPTSSPLPLIDAKQSKFLKSLKTRPYISFD
jgi:hypothetical protein